MFHNLIGIRTHSARKLKEESSEEEGIENKSRALESQGESESSSAEEETDSDGSTDSD
jgi:hypothetical protein